MLGQFERDILAALRAPDDATVGQWIKKTQPDASTPIIDGTLPPGAIVVGQQPVNVNATGLVGIPTQFQAKSAPLPSPKVTATAAPQSMPQAQMAASGNTPQGDSGSQKDTSVGLSVAPLQYDVVSTPGSPGGEVDMVGPKAHRIEIAATNMRSDAAQDMAHANAVAVANEAALYPERAKYYAALAEKEARDQGGRNEQNRQRLEDLDHETKELRDMEVDPYRRLKSGETIPDVIATLFGGIGQGFLRRAGIEAGNPGFEMAKANVARDIALQQDKISQKKGYIDQVRQALREQRDMQGDQVASNQRGMQFGNASFESQVRQAMLEGQAGKDIATGNAQSADQMAARMDQNAARIRNVQPSGGGQQYVVKDPSTGATMVMDRKEFNAHIKDVSKDVRGTGLGIVRDTAKVDAEGKGKKEEDMSKRLVPRADGSSYYAATAEEAKAHREADLAAAQLKGAVQEMKALRDKLGAADVSGINTEDARRIKSLQAQASVSFGKMKGLGTYDSGMERLAEQIFGDPTGMRSPVANYDSLIGRIDADAAARARSPEGPLRPNMPQSFKPAGK